MSTITVGHLPSWTYRSMRESKTSLPGDDSAPVDISLSQGKRGRRPDIQLHRMSFASADVTTVAEIPVTSVPRTVLDLAGLFSGRDLERVLAQADRLHHLDTRKLRSLVNDNAGRPGVPLLRTFLEKDAGPALTRSEAEERFLALIRKVQLPAPETNVRVGDYEVDFLWRRERLIVEVDGFAYHGSKRQFESDRRRDARLAAMGFTVIRVTWRQIVDEPEAMLVAIAQALTLARVDFGDDGLSRHA